MPGNEVDTRDNKAHLKRRINFWRQKSILALVDEVKTIQNRLTSSSSKNKNKAENVTITFSTLMQHGKLNQALKLLSEDSFYQPNGMLKLP